MKHLAIFDSETAGKIFDGKKKIEGRFSKIKIPPFGKASRGDLVLIKVSGEKIIGQFTVDRVLSFEHPTKDEVEFLKRRYKGDLAMPDTFWLDHEIINYITLIFIKSVTKFLIPPEVKKSDLRPWVVLE